MLNIPPDVLEDEIGLKLLAPDKGWRRRGDMDPRFTRPFRASVVARARFIEDLVVKQAGRGLGRYLILGARGKPTITGFVVHARHRQ